ncbi:glyoxalase [Candidatus Aerophobetes bacterium]|uniref:Glyoxalase n=1 Tax=Aerophobetes bacterium TaxID=2030807 RepID=A0A2A4X8Q0_UNCAE|nr:MAG: glyoxalase [Candidatus Aerophobetes bacterium]
MHLGYVIIYVENVVATVKFYAAAFGLKQKFLHESNQYAEMHTGQTVLAFAGEKFIQSAYPFQTNRLAKQAAGAEVAFVVKDVEKSFTKAVDSGAIVVLKPSKKPWGQTVSHVRDNNGFIVELCSPVSS